MAKQFTLGKNERLKSRKAIEQLFKEGKSFVVTPLRLYYVFNEVSSSLPTTEKNTVKTIQFGAGVSTKNFKKAVDRNRIKRLTKEAYRLQKGIIVEGLNAKYYSLNVFLIFTARELPNYQLLYDKVGVILKKLVNKLNENDSTNS